MSASILAGRVDSIIERLHALHPRLIDLSLDRLQVLLAKLGHPERRLPPVIHVAGTNGKGSTCAFLRAMAEAAGMRVHVYTSPHLVRFNERIRLAGTLVSDAALGDVLTEVEAANDGAAITVFEVITAVAFELFARVPADLCVLEVGLGGRFDATNVIPAPAVAAITSVSMDHREFLGDSVAKIAFEKAGIIKPGAPAVTGHQPHEALAVIQTRAEDAGTRLFARRRDWTIEPSASGFRYEDQDGPLDLHRLGLTGTHQIDNAGIAVAALRAAGREGVARSMAGPRVSPLAMSVGAARADWPARLQLLTGRLAARLPASWELWLDGGHNAGAGLALARHLRDWRDRPTHLIVGMKQAKDAAEFLKPMLPHAASLWAVSEPGQHLAFPVDAIIAASGGLAFSGPTVADALRSIATREPPGRVLICGSLYLAGEVLKADG